MMVAEDIQLMRETRDATDRRLIHRCIEGDQGCMVLELMYMSGGRRSYEEIAEALGMPAASIGPTRIRSLKKLRKLLR